MGSAARDWHWPQWTLLVVIVLGEAMTVVVFNWFVMFAFSSTCNQAPDPGDVRTGRLTLLVVLLVAALPWVVATFLRRDLRTRLLWAGLVACAPAALFLLAGLNRDVWSGGFCF